MHHRKLERNPNKINTTTSNLAMVNNYTMKSYEDILLTPLADAVVVDDDEDEDDDALKSFKIFLSSL